MMLPMINRHVAGLLGSVSSSLLLIYGACAQTVDRPILTLAGARTALQAAEEKAAALHRPSCIAVVDTGGHLLLFERMEGAWLAGAELSLGKARSAALFGKPTAALEDTINGGRTALVTAGVNEMQGGVPVIVRDQVVGAIGVSGSEKDGDVPVAEAGVSAVAKPADKTDGHAP